MVTSVWLQGEVMRNFRVQIKGNKQVTEIFRLKKRRESWQTINPILGFNLEGSSNKNEAGVVGSLDGLAQVQMEHDIKESPLENIDGRKRPSSVRLDSNFSRISDLLESNDECESVCFKQIPVTASRHADNENFELERSWFEESTDSSKNSMCVERRSSPNCLLNGDKIEC